MRYLIVFFILLILFVVEATEPIIPLSLIFIYCVSLVSTAKIRYWLPFLGGLFIDALTFRQFGTTSIFLLTAMFVLGFYRHYFTRNIFITMGVCAIMEILFFLFLGDSIAFFNIALGALLFLPLFLLIRLYLSPLEDNQLEFDFINR